MIKRDIRNTNLIKLAQKTSNWIQSRLGSSPSPPDQTHTLNVNDTLIKYVINYY